MLHLEDKFGQESMIVLNGCIFLVVFEPGEEVFVERVWSMFFHAVFNLGPYPGKKGPAGLFHLELS